MINTSEELIRYLYHETSPSETQAIEKAVKANWELQEKLDELKVSLEQLDTIVVSPRKQSVMAILNYAKNSLEVEQS